jgi:hypothetical protein
MSVTMGRKPYNLYRVVSKDWSRGLYWKSRWPAVMSLKNRQLFYRHLGIFEGSFGEILSLLSLSK